MRQLFSSMIFGLACSLLSLVLGLLFRVTFLTVLFRAGVFFLVGGFVFFVLMRIFSFMTPEVEEDNQEDTAGEEFEDDTDSVNDVQLEYDPLQFNQLNIGKEKNYVSHKKQTGSVQSKKEEDKNKDSKDRENDEKEVAMSNNKKDIVVDIRGRQDIDDIRHSGTDTGEDIQNIETNDDSSRSKNDQIEYNNKTEKDLHEDSIERTLEVFSEQSKSEEMNRSAEKTRNAFQKDRGRFANSLKHLINDN